MTKLSQELNQCPHSSPELDGVIENNPIYVTSVPDIQNATLERVKKNKRSSETLHSGPLELTTVNGHCDTVTTEYDAHDQELELKQEIRFLDAKNRAISEPTDLHRHFAPEEEGVPLCVNSYSEFPQLDDEDVISLDANDQPGITVTSSSDEQLDAMELQRIRHREMAVDVPDSFVAISKTPPRYPPPKPFGSNSDLHNGRRDVHRYSANSEQILLSEIDAKVTNGPLETPPTPRISELNKINNNSVQKPHLNGKVTRTVDMNGTEDVQKGMNLNENQLERIRKYQEDLRKRKEEEERIAKEEEFLRSSLRGSKKLQALEANPPATPRTGVVNTAFELEEGDAETLPIGRKTTIHNRLVGDIIDGLRAERPELKKVVALPELLQSLNNIEAYLQINEDKQDKLDLIENLLKSEQFQQILSIHNKIEASFCFNCPPTPICQDAQELAQDVVSLLHNCTSSQAIELSDLLSKYEIEGLLLSHDKVAERQIATLISPDEELLDRASQYTEESVKIVRIDKTSEPLGATVKNEGEAVVIGRIVKGGAAEKSGLLREGDEILEVNGLEIRGKSVNDVCDILANMTGTLVFVIIPNHYDALKNPARESVMHVKAHFDYDPDDDLYIPCRELGISFQKGDILHVLSQDDPNWWQAYREGEEELSLAGLIPSNSFQQQRESMKQHIVAETNNIEKTKRAKLLCAKRHHKRKKKKVMYNPAYNNEEFDLDQILAYEEVALYYPRANRKRPVVLIGPPNIGRHELRQKLMEDTERFAAAIPHTSRPRRDGELNGMDYHFITRAQFETDIMASRFVEHGEYEKNYYGTSLDAIRSVVNAGKICVLNLHPQSLKILKNSDLKPYVVFVAPPSLEKLRQNRIKMSLPVKDDELKEIIERAREMEENYGHYFDLIIINSDIDKAYCELLHEISVIEREPQWVPGSWLKNDGN